MSNVKTRPITEQSGCSIAAAFKKLEIECSYTFSRNTLKGGRIFHCAAVSNQLQAL